MTSIPTILDSDFRYIDKFGNLLKSRTELSIAQMLNFLGLQYQYQVPVKIDNQKYIVDFKTRERFIEVIDNEEDVTKFKLIKKLSPQTKIMAVGNPKYAAKIKELQEIVFYDQKNLQTGSIFMEDQSFTFDYAHILPLVEKCSILHGHTSSVLVELIGKMENNLLMDFGDAKKIIKKVINEFDHKFFINKKYLKNSDNSHYQISFKGPQGMFDLQVPKQTTYLLEGEATVENLSTEMIKLLVPKLPSNIEAVGVYIYEGYNKGSHIISNIRK